MSDRNEFADHSIEELKQKQKKFKAIQKVILILCLITSSIAIGVSIWKETSELYPVIGLTLIIGIGYPIMAFGPMQKKIQAEIDSRSQA
ncbi:hypothetical protein [Roseivirga sp. E12]|uniref:hypothetical protein n=1 Tax=Roseivirga sp. E12 TaxID=2819237 RepID=UPI001ABC8781|nr:hypothetical protein [Roseivirga sp. E12]MBO3700449.1 hypothetical protein [Roseivirga sp. E12]